MKCPQCSKELSENIPVCIHCGAEVGTCVHCREISYFIDISFPQKIERIFAYVLLGLSFNYSKVKFRQCALCRNHVQMCINCGRVFEGMNKCPYCLHSHFVGTYSIIKYLKPAKGGRDEG